MKNIKLLLLAFVAIAATSCGDDDDSPGFELNQENIAGTYTLTSLSIEATETETLNSGSQITTTIDVTGDTFSNTRFVLNSNGTFSSSGNYRTTTVTKVGNQPSESETEIVDFIQNGTYSIDTSSRTLTLIDSDGTTIADVRTFSNSELRLNITETDSDPGYSFEAISDVRFERL